MVDVSAPARPSFGWILWPAGVAGLTVLMVPVAIVAPVLCLVAGAGLGWWAGRRGSGYPTAMAATLAGCVAVMGYTIVQHLSGVDRTGELVGGAVFAAGAALLGWAVSALARRAAAVGLAVAGGLVLLHTSCYVLVTLATSGVRVSPWLWYVGSMFPYGAWQNSGPLMPPDHGYLPSNDWFELSDSLVWFPGEWTFLLAFLLVCAISRGSMQRGERSSSR